MSERQLARVAAYGTLIPATALMIIAFIAPLVIFFRNSFNQFRRGRLIEAFSLETYSRFLTDSYYHGVILETLRIAGVVTLAAVVIGYPLAFALWRLSGRSWQAVLALIVFMPLVVSVVVRSYGWTVLLAENGPINFILLRLGLVNEPLKLVYNSIGVIISLTQVNLAFVVFPIYASMARLEPALKEAALDLGAGWWTAFRRITLPLTLPGVVAGAQLCFTLSLGAFVTPTILGGGRVMVLPIQIYRATAEINWPTAAVGGIVLLVMALLSVMLFNRLLRFSEVI